MMLAPFSKMFHSGLRGQQKTEHVRVEYFVEVVRRNIADRSEFINAGIVDQNVEPPVIRDRSIDNALRVTGFGDIALYGYSFAAGVGDCGNYCIRARLARRVVHHNRCSLRCDCLSDGGSNTFGSAGNDCDFSI